jgi:hypothetical protein
VERVGVEKYHEGGAMDAFEIALMILLIILAAALVGVLFGQKLVPHHVTPETNRVISTSTAVVGTMTALVISLLISSASNSLSTRNEAVAKLSADIVQLDELLRRYGPEANAARTALQHYVKTRMENVFGNQAVSPVTSNRLDEVQDQLLELHPSDDRQRWLIGQALQ